MISTIVFDFDGTLVDSNAIKRQGFFDVVTAHPGGRARMMTVLERTPGDRRAVFEAYVAAATAAGTAPGQQADALVRAYSERVDSLVAAAPDMPGAARLLAQLRRHDRRLYLSSATPVESLWRIVQQRGWLPYFDEVLGHPSSKYESLQRICDRAGSAEAVAVVGDGADDRDSAARAGCRFFPVGEARGGHEAEHVYWLPELLEALLQCPETSPAR